MKKVLVVLATFFMLGNCVNAMSKSDLEDKLTKTYTINGNEFKANDSQKVQIKRYLAKNEISESDADYIAKEIDEAINIIEESGVTKFKELNSTYKAKIRNIAKNITSNTNFKISMDNDENIVLYNTDGTLFTKFSDVIKNTGNVDVVFILSVISIVGVIYFAIKIKRENY